MSTTTETVTTAISYTINTYNTYMLITTH